MDLLNEDWFNQLLIANENIKNNRVDMMPFIAVPTPVVDLIFLKCCLFGQPDEVRYLSVELFDRFIRLHFLYLLEKVWTKDERLANKQWKQVERKINDQASLRMLSCIQLASKFLAHPKGILKPIEIQSYLEAENKMYTLPIILASEMRVWKTLNLQLNIPTVFTYVNLLLEQIKLCAQLDFYSEDVQAKAILLTDTVYLHHQEVYRKLFYLSTGRWEATHQEKRMFILTECNLLHRAAAVVALAFTFTPLTNFDEQIYEKLSVFTHISPDDIQALAKIIKQIILS